MPYSARQMFALVDDVDAYQEFLPWCSRSQVESRSGNLVRASLEIRKGAISKTFTTENTTTPGRAIEIGLVGGPFRHLAGGWRFEPLAEDGCRVTLDLEFEFDSRLTDLALGAFFEETCSSLIDAFTRRADELYGH